MRVIYFNARGSRHILGGDFRLFQSGSHLSFLRHISKRSEEIDTVGFCNSEKFSFQEKLSSTLPLVIFT